jgi:predicted NAD/FAD-dependent oxidoreductase
MCCWHSVAMLGTRCLLVTALWSSPATVVVRGLASVVVVATKRKPSTKTVAIIGGGIAGLSCANQLSSAGTTLNDGPTTIYNVTVFDTGRLRSGGRCSSRNPHDSPNTKSSSVQRRPVLSRYLYDHAAQIISLPTPDNGIYADFVNQVQIWIDNGVIQPFPTNSVFQIIPSSSSTSHKKLTQWEPLQSSQMFHGTNGMSSIPTAMANSALFDVRQDVWVSPSNGVQYVASLKKWKVQSQGRSLGLYDYLIIAHNGKCADRLMSTTPCTELHQLLRVHFAPSVPFRAQPRMTLNSMYSLTVAIPVATHKLSRHVPATFVAGFVPDHADVRFVSCQTRKYPPQSDPAKEMQVWTVLSTANFAKKYKAPQEFLTDETIDRVTSKLLAALEQIVIPTAAASAPNTPTLESCIVDRHLQLWGAAVPLNIWHSSSPPSTASSSLVSAPPLVPAGFLYDARYNVGVCGDWLLEASIGGAWTSGRLLANHVRQLDANEQNPSHGLQGEFQSSGMTTRLGIGAVATTAATRTKAFAPPYG